MNEIQAKRVAAVLAWISKYHKVPRMIISQFGDSVQCVGTVSNSKIRISLENVLITVNKDSNFGIIGNPKEQFVYAESSDGSRLQCNLNENLHITTINVLSGGPTGKISVNIKYDKVITQYFGSSTEFNIQI